RDPRQNVATVGACLQAIASAGTTPVSIACKAGSYSAMARAGDRYGGHAARQHPEHDDPPREAYPQAIASTCTPPQTTTTKPTPHTAVQSTLRQRNNSPPHNAHPHRTLPRDAALVPGHAASPQGNHLRPPRRPPRRLPP